MRKSFLFLFVLVILSVRAERQPFDRYQSILDRQMFGPPPEGFDPTKIPSEVAKAKASKELTKEQEQLKSAVHYSVINMRSDGKVEVGFSDNSDPKTPHHYFICEGETAGGWTVESADPDTTEITLVKDGIQLELTLGDNSAKGGGNASRLAPGAASQDTRRTSYAAGSGLAQSARSRRLQREQQARAEQAERDRLAAQKEAERAQREEQEKAERDAEREQNRQQLQAIQEELKKAREAREAESKKSESSNSESEQKQESAEHEGD